MSLGPHLFEPAFSLSEKDKGKWELYFSLMKTTLSALLLEYENEQHLLRALPIIKNDSIEKDENSFSVYMLYHSDGAHGALRVTGDIISTYLVPGVFTHILFSRSVQLRFKTGEKSMTFCEFVVQTPALDDTEVAQANLPRLFRTLRLTLLAGRNARRLMGRKPLTQFEKEMLAHENIVDFFEASPRHKHSFSFSSLPNSLLRELTPESMEMLTPSLLSKKSNTFNRGIFFDLFATHTHLPSLLSKTYGQKLLTRILSHIYIYKKLLSYDSLVDEQKNRRLSHLFPTTVNEKGHVTSFGVLLVTRSENDELFTLFHLLLKQLKTLFPSMDKKDDFCFAMYDVKVGASVIYIDFEKAFSLPFSKTERKALLQELKKQLNRTEREQKKSSALQSHSAYEFIENKALVQGISVDPLLNEYIHGFSVPLEEKWFEPLAFGFFMLTSLNEKSGASHAIQTATQVVDNVFIFTLFSNEESLEIDEFLHSYKGQENTLVSSFPLLGASFAALLHMYTSQESLQTFRRELTQRFQEIALLKSSM